MRSGGLGSEHMEAAHAGGVAGGEPAPQCGFGAATLREVKRLRGELQQEQQR